MFHDPQQFASMLRQMADLVEQGVMTVMSVEIELEPDVRVVRGWNGDSFTAQGGPPLATISVEAKAPVSVAQGMREQPALEGSVRALEAPG